MDNPTPAPHVDLSFSIRPVFDSDVDEILAVYRQCEDFLALGPVPHASMQMVLADLELSRQMGGTFCGIFLDRAPGAALVGVLDFVPEGFEGQPGHAYLSLLMISRPYRSMGLGAAVVRWFEAQIEAKGRVGAILAGVQSNNPAAIRFWERMGYQITGPATLHPDGTTAYPLVKHLQRIESRE